MIFHGCKEERIGQTQTMLKEISNTYGHHIRQHELQQLDVEGHIRTCFIQISKLMTYLWERICSERSEIYIDNSLKFCDVYIFYHESENGPVDVKHLCHHYVISHNWKKPGENFMLLTSRTCHLIFYVELPRLWTVNSTIFRLF